MGKLIYYVHQSVDGFIEGPNGEFDWPLMGPELDEYSIGMNDHIDAFLYGRGVWTLMSGYWPNAEEIGTDEHGRKFAPIWREKPKYVVSNTVDTTEWQTTVLRDPTEVAKIKEQHNLLLTGGAALAASLTEAGLIDDYQIFVHPVVLGGGKQVLPTSRINDMTLTESRIFDGKVVLLRYTRQSGS